MSRGDKKKDNKTQANRTQTKQKGLDATGFDADVMQSDAEASGQSTGGEDDAPDQPPSDLDAITVTGSLSEVDVKQTKLRPPKTLETTLFDRLEGLYGPGIKRVLKVQYRYQLKLSCPNTRMNEHIAQFPSVTLYNGELISAPSVAKHTLLDLPTIISADSDDAKDALEAPVVFFDTAGCEFYERTESDETPKRIGEGSKSNENEAAVVAKWARRLVC